MPGRYDALRNAVEAARARREGLIDPARTDAFRIANGAGDFLDGLSVDRYGDFVLLTSFEEPDEAWLHDAVAAASSVLAPRGVLVRRRLGQTDAPAEMGAGERPPEELVVRERGVRFAVRLLGENQTGLFLDQRENREALAPRCPGARLLNLFCYTGAFTVAALVDGAAETTSVDLAAPCLERLRRNLELNDLPAGPPRARIVRADAFDWLGLARRKGLRFDIVIADPPTFARSKRGRGAPIDRRWPELAEGACALLAPGGLLVASSNSARQSAGDLLAAVREGARRAGRSVGEVERRGAGRDFPEPPGPPGPLKVLFARID